MFPLLSHVKCFVEAAACAALDFHWAVEAERPAFGISRMTSTDDSLARLRHDLRNHLNAALIGVRLLKEELTAGDRAAAEITYQEVVDHLVWLQCQPPFTLINGYNDSSSSAS